MSVEDLYEAGSGRPLLVSLNPSPDGEPRWQEVPQSKADNLSDLFGRGLEPEDVSDDELRALDVTAEEFIEFVADLDRRASAIDPSCLAELRASYGRWIKRIRESQ